MPSIYKGASLKAPRSTAAFIRCCFQAHRALPSITPGAQSQQPGTVKASLQSCLPGHAFPPAQREAADGSPFTLAPVST